MTKKFENTPRAQEIATLFQAHEDAVAAYNQAANDGMENSDPAQFYAVQVTMGEAYRTLVDFLDMPAQARPAYEFTTREGFEVGIQAEPAFMAALGASQKASDAQSAADAVDMEHTDKVQHDAICDALIVADDHLCEVIEAYAAYMSALAVSRVALLHKPAPITPAKAAPQMTDVFQSIAELEAALKTPAPVKAATVPDTDVQSLYTRESINEDDVFDKLFMDAQAAAHVANEADRAGLEQSDRAQWETLDAEMQRTYHALLDYINDRTNERIAAAIASIQKPAPRCLLKLPKLVSITESDTYEAALMEYAGAVERYHDVTHIHLGTPEHRLVDAAGARSTACNNALNAVIDAHCADQVAAVVNALIPAPPRRSRTTPRT